MKLIYQCSRGEIEQSTHICFKLYQVGRDWLLAINGGDEHIGAVSLTDKASGKTQHFSLYHHKELYITQPALQKLRHRLSGEVLVMGGIHYSDISKEQIEKIVFHADALTSDLISFIERHLN